MKRYLFALMLCCMSMGARAQWFNNNPVRNFEWELKFGLAATLNSEQPFCSAKVGTAYGTELRYNFKKRPFNLGMAIDYLYIPFTENNEFHSKLQKQLITLKLVSEYDFKRGAKINPFVGAGFGVGIVDCTVFPDHYDSDGNVCYIDRGNFCRSVFSLRAGVELLHHIRLSGQFNFPGIGYNNFALTLGAVIGGRPKNKK